MTESFDLKHVEQLIERIVFDEEELETIKIAIKNFTEGKTSAKDLKVLLLQCRGRMMDDITDFIFLFAKKRSKNQLEAEKSKSRSTSTTKVESQLREEIKEKNELLEIVAQRVNQLVSKIDTDDSREDQMPISIDEVKEEIERCLTQIGAKEWIEICFYTYYKFFSKLYPKLESLYKERLGESDDIMANKMVELGFPEEIEDMVINYVSIRNNFQHSMVDITPSHLGVACKVFVYVLVDLILNALNSELLLNHKEMLCANLTDFFSKRLTGNPPFRKEMVERINAVFNA